MLLERSFYSQQVCLTFTLAFSIVMRVIMSTAPITMKKLKDILRLKYAQELTHRQIAKSLSVSASAVSRYVARAAKMGIKGWPLDDNWDDATLRKTFLHTKTPLKKHSLPIWQTVQE